MSKAELRSSETKMLFDFPQSRSHMIGGLRQNQELHSGSDSLNWRPSNMS